MFGSFGWMELLLILIIVLIIFGAGKIPQLGEGLGKAIKGFKKSVHEPDAIDVTASEADSPTPQPTAQIQQAGQPAAPPPPQQAAAAPPPRETQG
ncbi:MAG: twin-arginine translocase TatA/TatE family subunit [Nitrospira sp.]|nr:MAG: twin-arginine translocase TatA/TatE family subunit [Nitrospira sp.]